MSLQKYVYIFIRTQRPKRARSNEKIDRFAQTLVNHKAHPYRIMIAGHMDYSIKSGMTSAWDEKDGAPS